jgi:hypothetical protein
MLFIYSLFFLLVSYYLPLPYLLPSFFPVQDCWFKHFDVEERGKRPGHTGLAPQLYVKEVIPAEQRGTYVRTYIHSPYIRTYSLFPKIIRQLLSRLWLEI